MIAVLLLLLGVTAVLSPSAIGVSAARRDIRVRLVIAQIISLVLGALLSVLVLDLPWWQTALAILPAGLWAAATQLSAPRTTLGRWGTRSPLSLCARHFMMSLKPQRIVLPSCAGAWAASFC